MCGIAGFLSRPTSLPFDRWPSVLQAMGQSIAHRGPDDSGIWTDNSAGIGLVHRRLSIVDLSEAGHQPMTSPSGRYVMVFNGEIYNHTALRADLEKNRQNPVWRGHSDTETLLAGFDIWGMEKTIQLAIGMFAIAVWDTVKQTLTLIRDRLGEKPLFYGWQGGVFLFGSELKALRAHPSFDTKVDRNVLMLLLRHNYIPAPYSIYEGIRKLLPGAMLEISLKDTEAQPHRYWDARDVIASGLARPFSGSPDEAVEALEELLRDAVKQQMAADVPLGAFLSGGIDSSTIVSLMQAQSNRPVKTFTIGFEEEGYNEAEHAKAVALHLGTEHTELYVSAQQALDVIPHLPGLYDEPFSDSSQIPTFLVSQLTRQHVTVSLSGDAGDELFCGYSRYMLSDRVWSKLSILSGNMRTRLAGMMRGISMETWNRMAGPFRGFLPDHLARANLGDKIHKVAERISVNDRTDLYRMLVSHWPRPDELVSDAVEPPTVLTDKSQQPMTDNFLHEMMGLDLLSYLPGDILAKIDRAAMGVSLETRVPLLDHRVVEFAWHLPLDYKVRQGVQKWPLRQVLLRHVPGELIDRPKMGFGVPIDSWLRGPLRDWAEALLDESRLRGEGYFNPEPIRLKWREHLNGTYNWSYYLWDVLMFQTWLETQ